VQTDVDAVVLNELEQPVALERQADEVVDRVPDDRAEDGDDREDQPVRSRPTPDTAP